MATPNPEDTIQVKWFTPDELRNFSDAENYLRTEIDELLKYLLKNYQNKDQ